MLRRKIRRIWEKEDPTNMDQPHASAPTSVGIATDGVLQLAERERLIMCRRCDCRIDV